MLAPIIKVNPRICVNYNEAVQNANQLKESGQRSHVWNPLSHLSLSKTTNKRAYCTLILCFSLPTAACSGDFGFFKKANTIYSVVLIIYNILYLAPDAPNVIGFSSES